MVMVGGLGLFFTRTLYDEQTLQARALRDRHRLRLHAHMRRTDVVCRAMGRVKLVHACLTLARSSCSN